MLQGVSQRARIAYSVAKLSFWRKNWLLFVSVDLFANTVKDLILWRKQPASSFETVLYSVKLWIQLMKKQKITGHMTTNIIKTCVLHHKSCVGKVLESVEMCIFAIKNTELIFYNIIESCDFSVPVNNSQCYIKYKQWQVKIATEKSTWTKLDQPDKLNVILLRFWCSTCFISVVLQGQGH